MDDYLEGALRLVSIESGRNVEGSVRPGIVRSDGEPADGYPNETRAAGAFSFVPTGALAEGWYVLVLDMRAWPDDLPPYSLSDTAHVEDDVMYARIHVASAPTWYLADFTCDPDPPFDTAPYCEVDVAWSEAVANFGMTVFTLEVNGAPAPSCSSSRSEHGMTWECPHYPAGTEFTIDLVESDVIRAFSEEARTLSFSGGGIAAPPYMLVAPRFGVDIADAAE